MRFVVLFFSFFCSFIFSQHSAEVALSTSNPLVPVYVSEIGSDEYGKQLLQVFLYDLSHNARTKIAHRTDVKETRLRSKELTEQFNKYYWQQEGIKYVVKVRYSNNVFSAHVFNGTIGIAKEFSTKTLSHNLSRDRSDVHAVSDAIVGWLFSDKGIANSSILFAKQLPIGDRFESEIWEVDYDGNNPRKLLDSVGYCVTPYSIPHSDSYLFVSYKQGVPKIFIGYKKRKEYKPLINLRGNQLLPAISANRRKLAFICDASGRADLFLQVFDEKKGCIGKPIQAYSFPSSVQASPTLSPDGSRVAFVSDKSGTPRVYMIEAPRYSRGNKLPEAVLLSKECRENTSPCWSPDGKKIAYSARIEGIRQIVIFDLVLGEEWQVTSGPLHKENPSWAPNSLHLVYNTVDGEKSDLFMIDIQEKMPTKITSGPGKKHFPSWGSSQP